ncbi:MAG: molecular chaperone TorD family protein [Myxococcota bacterium]|nr:molecular chaperone TorD family protein [Myxococcota bacterium]
MTPQKLAVARGRSYDLLASLLAQGAWPRREHIAQLPSLSSLVPQTQDLCEAQHFQVLDRQVHPYLSVYLHPEGLRGGDVAASVRDTLSEVGFGGRDDVESDHIANVLSGLAFLCGAEADALADHQPAEVSRVRQVQRQVIDSCLLPAAPPLWVALLGQGGLYGEATGILVELVADHRQSLGAPADLPPLPAVEDILSHKKTGLKRIAQFLAHPVNSGGLWTQQALGAIGDAAGLPRGFGSRWQVIENLMRSGVQHDGLPAVLQGMDAELSRWLGLYGQWDAQGLNTGAWQVRVQETRGMLGRMAEALREGLAEEASGPE